MKVLLTVLLFITSAFAHFQTVIVDKSILEQKDGNEINIDYEFTHPFEQELMNMVKPQDAGVFMDGKKISFL
ncbi:MAG: DUF4198 domain-containing protein, partial [Campylobacteraceae bacterium]|nr:DUF4198 domain-containing protein [Campylobacteraceae bacterium]